MMATTRPPEVLPPHIVVAGGVRVKLRKKSQLLGWSIERLARECGLHWTNVGQVGRGQCNIGYLNLLRIAKALGALMAQLVSDG
jgi:hypothetical protein